MAAQFIRISTIILAFVSGIASANPAASDRGLDRIAFERLSDKDKLNFVLAQLDSREQQLQNFSYELKETHTNVAIAGGKRRFMYSSAYTVRRIGGKWWMHLVNCVYYVPNKTGEDAFLNWDGEQARSLGSPPYLGVSYAKCSIRPHENGNFRERRFNELLGFEVTIGVEKRGVSMPEWVRRATRHPEESISISAEEFEGVPVVRLNVRVGDMNRNILLDPARGYMTVRFERNYQAGKGYNRSLEKVLAAQQVSGVWVPTKCSDRIGTSAAQEETEITYDVSKFTIGMVKEGDTDIEFPVGSEVFDATKRISYFIQPDERYKLLPVANIQAHKVYIPKQAVVDHIDKDTAANAYREQPIVPTVMAAKAPAWSVSRLTLTAVSALIAVALLIIGVSRRRRLRSKT
ncbi:MAG TPA: hypothetical protein VFC78_15565 [Tepidisphaeraceae bacterium]|nr:hypothetical protein [Tepidisphaeraceae bacterium]